MAPTQDDFGAMAPTQDEFGQMLLNDVLHNVALLSSNQTLDCSGDYLHM